MSYVENCFLNISVTNEGIDMKFWENIDNGTRNRQVSKSEKGRILSYASSLNQRRYVNDKLMRQKNNQ